MTFYKQIDEDRIVCIGSGIDGKEITEQEYEEILSVIRSCPTPPEGKGCRLKTDLTWELYDLPIPEPEPVSESDIVSALMEVL